MADICVIGAGPAGSTFAARMAQLGHAVWIVERARFPRRHLGESLSPGVLPLLETFGAREAVESAGFRRVGDVLVKWDSELQIREESREEALIVDRGEFDQLLLARAKALGVRVLQPARVLERRSKEQGWIVDVCSDNGRMKLVVDFLVDARGRTSSTQQRRRTGANTLALYAYWRGRNLPREPRIEAGDDAWYWGVPLPDGTYNTLVFVDVEQFRAARYGSVTKAFLELLSRSGLMTACRDVHLASAVHATDATPYVHDDSVTPSSIRVGEAALAIDPISSSGVQKAIQNALGAAVVTNTLLRSPSSSEHAMRFYTSNIADASERHAKWAASHYARVAERHGGKFWNDRGMQREVESAPPPAPQVDASALVHTAVTLSGRLEFVEMPCIEGDYVTVKRALQHPHLDGPIVYLGGRELAPLLQEVRAGSTPVQLAQSWADRVPLRSGLAIVGWLFNNGLLVAQHTIPERTQ